MSRMSSINEKVGEERETAVAVENSSDTAVSGELTESAESQESEVSEESTELQESYIADASEEPDVLAEMIESANEVIEEITEKINVLDLLDDESEKEHENFGNGVKVSVLLNRFTVSNNLLLILTSLSLIIAIVAVVMSVNANRFTSDNGDVPVKGGMVYEQLGNVIRNELAVLIPDKVRIREIKVKVVIYGDESVRYGSVRDIRESDSVSAEIVFFPQKDVESFAEDCRAVLDAMMLQDLVYDSITFSAKNVYTSIKAELSGRFGMDISVKDLKSITYYYGQTEVLEDIDDIDDI
ncbi:MAG: hypothetical protein FWF82_04050 [Oscillospiraceae bacterium]|nr:hypothetical protein [Oscillospiraceae bacterium]